MPKKGQISNRTVTTGLRQRAWWVMRRRCVFTIPELLSILADGTERDAYGSLSKYLRALEKAGIIKREDSRKPGNAQGSNGHLSFRLVINEGRKAPVWRAKTNAVYDPNTSIEYSLEVKDE